MKTIRFQHWVVASVSGLVLLLSAVFLGTVFGEFRKTAESGAADKFALVSRAAGDQLQATLTSHARRARALAAADLGRQLQQGQLPWDEVLDLLGTSVLQYPGVYSEYLGLPNDDFIQAIAVREDPQVVQALEAPPATVLALRWIRAERPQAPRREHWRFLGKDSVLLGSRQGDARYRPSARPWFAGAMSSQRAFLTAPYLFASTQRPGVTVAAAMPEGDGVYGIDISLHTMPGVLASYLTSDNAYIGLLDDQGRVLVAHGKGRAVATASEAMLQPLSAASDPRLQGIAGLLSGLTSDSADFVEVQGERLLVTTRRLDVGSGSPYQVLMWAPQSDFTGPVDRARRVVLWVTAGVLLLLVPLALVGTRGISASLARMANESERLRSLDFSAEPQAVHSYLYEVDALGQAQAVMHRSVKERTLALEEAQSKLERIVATGIELGRQQDREALLKEALFGVREIAHCQAATLFLKTERDTLRFALRTSDDPLPLHELPLHDEEGNEIHRFVASHVALTGETVLINDIYAETHFDVSGTKRFSEQSGMRVVSMLNVPLKPREGEVIGLFQLMNALDPQTGTPVPFEPEVVRFVEALAAQAAVAIDNHHLLEAQKALMDSMIQIIAGAIDTKSPYTGGHCERVPELAMMLAEQASQVKEGPLADFEFKTEDEWREFRIAAWLHDCGKVTTPEFVVDKATKLETIFNRIHEVRMRFEVLLRDADLERLRAIHERGEDSAQAQARYESRRSQLFEDFAFVAECNLGGEFMAPERIERLHRIASETWVRHFDDRLGLSHEELRRVEREPEVPLPTIEPLLADKPRHLFDRPHTEALDEKWGFRLQVPQYLYHHGELHNLSIARGTLTEEERFKVNEHIVQTIVMLEQMPLPPNLQRLPEYAGTHHETLTGSGYPRGLGAEQLSVPSRIMAIADIFEALTASDRPYKKAKTLSESIAILHRFKQDRHVDPVLFDLFLRSGVYKTYAERFLRPDQIDEVDVGRFLD
jgi:HD-GYP domain-containing protein (c-di-GMP phosphodiesterase class II)